MGAATVPFTCNAEISLLLLDFTQISIVTNLNVNLTGKGIPGNLIKRNQVDTIQNPCSWLRRPMLGVAGWGVGCVRVVVRE